MARESDNKSLNVWDYKPWWCQPWSIILTGTVAIASSWLLLHTIWISVLVSVPIVVWWVYFLILYPQMMKQYLASQTTETFPLNN